MIIFIVVAFPTYSYLLTWLYHKRIWSFNLTQNLSCLGRQKRFLSWQGWKDSNPQERFWRPACYHYIIPLYSILYKTEQIQEWWTVRDSNPGPTGYEPVALPTELTVHIPLKRLPPRYRDGNTVLLAPPVGFEPTTLRLTAACSTCWAKEAKFKGFDIRQTLCVGIDLSSRSVSRQVLSALVSLTSVFGMGTGGPSPLKTPTIFRHVPWKLNRGG